MADWYLDYQGGSENSSGDSFAVTLTLADLVANGTTTVTSVTGGFTGLSGRKIFIVGIGGRSISSVTNNNTAVLNASVSAGTYTANVGGRRKDMTNMTTANCQGFAAGDTVKCKASPTPTTLSATGNWADCSPTIILGGTSTDVASCETAWTASANVTATADATIFKVGTKSAKIDIAAGFTTGLAAYFATGTLDLSGSQILTFWMHQSAGTNIVAGDILVKLCSDTAGVTSVNSFTVPLLPIGGSAAGAKFSDTAGTVPIWVPVSVDFGAALGASIQSIAIYVGVDRGAQTFYFDDFKVWTSPALTKNVYMDATWTTGQGANVTCTTSTTRKEGATSASIAVAAGATTGLVAYYATGTLDLSGYQQLSFAISQTAGTLLTGTDYSLTLCSDTAGATPVNTIAIPSLSTSATSNWHRFTVDTGGNLGASIQSIGLTCNTDTGAVTLLLDNVIACKASSSADSISLTSLVGRPNSTGAGGTDIETWYAIRSINGNTITLETGPNSSAGTASRGYYGGSVYPPAFDVVWKRETIKTTMVAASSTVVQAGQVSGSSGNLVAYSGGWNTTDMSTQTGETWLDGQNGLGVAINPASTFNSFAKFGLVRYANGIGSTFSSTTDKIISYCHGNCCSALSALPLNARDALTNCFANNNATSGVGVMSSSVVGITITNLTAHNNITSGLTTDFIGSVSTNIVACNNTSIGIQLGNNNANSEQLIGFAANRNGTGGLHTGTVCGLAVSGTIIGNGSQAISIVTLPFGTLRNCTTGLSGIRGITTFNGRGGQAYLDNCVLADTTEVGAQTVFQDLQILSTRHDQTDDNHWGFTDGGTFNSQTTTRHTASGIAWQVNPTSTNRSVTYPLRVSLGTYAVPSGTTTISLWMRRTNTGLTMSLMCPQYQLPGITTDVTASMTAVADTWEQVSLNISPTSAGVVELFVLAYGGTTYTGYWDDLTVGGVAIPLDYAWHGSPAASPVVSAGSGGMVVPTATFGGQGVLICG